MRHATPWIAALLISVLANGVLIGFVLQREVTPDETPMRSERPGGPQAGGPGFDLRGFVGALPAEQRSALRERMESEMGDMRSLMRDARDARIAAAQALTAEPFDADAVREALARRRETRAAIEAHVEDVIVEIAGELDPETRERALREARRGPAGEGGFRMRRSPPDHRGDRRGPPPERREN